MKGYSSEAAIRITRQLTLCLPCAGVVLVAIDQEAGEWTLSGKEIRMR